MNELNDSDWELINAYHDGELGEATAHDLEVRIASEPALALVLKEVSLASSSLAALRPDTVRPTNDPVGSIANDNRKPVGWLAGGVVAAALAIAVYLGPKVLAEPTVLDIHAGFVEQSFSISGGDLRAVAVGESDGVPDLASANLTAVAVRSLDAGQVTHYAGHNGCRLSYFRGGFGIDEASDLPKHQIETWTTPDNLHHMIIASGMDQAKFDAIATYMRLETKKISTESIMAAVSDATTAATPCVG